MPQQFGMQYVMLLLQSTIMTDRQDAYIKAVEMNDEAQKKTLLEEDNDITQSRCEEIEEEAKMWLRHLDFIHRKT